MKKVAIITGASRGIGAAIAKALAADHYAVAINYLRSQQEAEDLVRNIEQQGGQALAIQANMANEEEILSLFSTVDSRLGPVNALVNNAGINGGICSVENIEYQQLQHLFATNVFGTFIATREAIKRMKKYGGGAIVNISSEAAKFGGNQLSHYAASKAAINTLTIGCAREVAPYNIRINTVSPGVINTEIHANSSQARIENLLKSLPMGRMGDPHEVAELVCWLLSDKSSYVSGAIFPVTGAR